MSSRPAGKPSAFDGLRPTVLREPIRRQITPDAEALILQSDAKTNGAGDAMENGPQANSPITGAVPLPAVVSDAEPVDTPLPSAPLLRKKNKPRLVLVTFRMREDVKLELERLATRLEVNQSDLINQGVELNLERYRKQKSEAV
jgi:hypothetical protein